LKKKREQAPRGAATPEPLPRPLGVVLIDSLNVVRAAIALLLAAQPDIEVLAQAADADEGLAAIRRLEKRSGVIVLVGLNLPGEHDCFWLLRKVRDLAPTLPILSCGANVDTSLVSRALFFGADGFVDKNSTPEVFLEAVRRVARGEVVLEGLPSNWLGPVVEELDQQRTAISPLTEREREVLAVAAQGLTARQIGTRLGLQERTVTTHLGRIYRKLGTGSRIAAVAAATRSGLVTMRSLE
jgi:DNA-binding NarL/FixJ family response regulator